MPAVALRVLELTSHPHVDVGALTECIENDPALASKILRVVNSSIFGLTERVGKLKQAIAMLGTRALKMLVLGFSLPPNLAARPSSEVLGRYWRHTLYKSVAARELAESIFHAAPDDAFLGGLLQNIGMLVLIQDLGETYERFLANVWEEAVELSVEERNVLGFDHQYLSAQLLEHWKLPPDFVEAVGTPHLPPVLRALDPARRTLPQVLHLADLIATFLIDQRTELLNRVLQVGQQYGGVGLPHLEQLMQVLEFQAPQLAEVLSLELPGGIGYAEILARAYQRLAQVLETEPGMPVATPTRPLEILKPVSLPVLGPESATPVFVMPPAATGPSAPFASAQSGVPVLPETAASVPPTWTHPADAAERQAELSTTFPWMSPEGLIGRLVIAVTRCRQCRSSLSLLLVELDEVERISFYCGVDRMPQVVKKLGVTIRDSIPEEGTLFQTGDFRFAILLDDCERRQAVEYGWRIVDGVRVWKFPVPTRLQAGVSVSAGIATLTMPPRNFPAEELLAAAQRCLSGVRLSGGNALKSIDIY